MTYTESENSLADGQPCRLYLFTRGTERWAYCNTNADRTLGGVEYRAIPIEDDGIRLTGQTSADQLVVTCPDDLPLIKKFRGIAPSDDIWLTIRDTHQNLPDAADSAAVVWVGTLRMVRRPEPGKAEIVCNSLSASMNNDGLRLSYERNCPHSLYDGNCRANMGSFKADGVITALDGATVTLGQLPQLYAGGIIEWRDGMATERRGIEAQAGDVLTILGGTDGLEAGMTVTIYPGCDQTSATCDARFSNILNYGGFRHLPGKSPFDGDPIY
ncbi:MAG: phage BR0599 family protein [Zoogloeaceae bacterium]|jgi:uncharacterized phage protein (TIGR02218 family)|nr:phage BR0599 family protein [Zoogloeaceae bacterium]